MVSCYCVVLLRDQVIVHWCHWVGILRSIVGFWFWCCRSEFACVDYDAVFVHERPDELLLEFAGLLPGQQATDVGFHLLEGLRLLWCDLANADDMPRVLALDWVWLVTVGFGSKDEVVQFARLSDVEQRRSGCEGRGQFAAGIFGGLIQ